MGKKKYDLAIAYRIYPKVSKTPPIFANDKYLLSELCLKSFRDALSNLNPYIYIILDGCPDKYKNLFSSILDEYDFEYIDMDGVGNAATFNQQMKILLEQDKSETIYFAEDDYFYFDNAFTEMLKAINLGEVDFVTPYDHPDTHDFELHDYKKEKIKIGSIDWIKCASTTLTFLTTQRMLEETKDIFRTYSKNNYDASIWMTLTKLNAYNFSLFLKSTFLNPDILKIYLKTYYYNFRKTLSGKRYSLIQPQPTLAVHMENQKLSKGFDWQKEFEKYTA